MSYKLSFTVNFIIFMLVLYLPNQWIVFFAHSDWLLKLRIASVIHLGALFWILRASFPFSLRKKGNIWCWPSTGLVYNYTETLISVGEEW